MSGPPWESAVFFTGGLFLSGLERLFTQPEIFQEIGQPHIPQREANAVCTCVHVCVCVFRVYSCMTVHLCVYIQTCITCSALIPDHPVVLVYVVQM